MNSPQKLLVYQHSCLSLLTLSCRFQSQSCHGGYGRPISFRIVRPKWRESITIQLQLVFGSFNFFHLNRSGNRHVQNKITLELKWLSWLYVNRGISRCWLYLNQGANLLSVPVASQTWYPYIPETYIYAAWLNWDTF